MCAWWLARELWHCLIYRVGAAASEHRWWPQWAYFIFIAPQWILQHIGDYPRPSDVFLSSGVKPDVSTWPSTETPDCFPVDALQAESRIQRWTPGGFIVLVMFAIQRTS